jgi:hypothetical protein
LIEKSTDQNVSARRSTFEISLIIDDYFSMSALTGHSLLILLRFPLIDDYFSMSALTGHCLLTMI